jgi:hypothetical protein
MPPLGVLFRSRCRYTEGVESMVSVEIGSMAQTTIKEEARLLVERLPEDATWEDLQYEIYFRQAVEAGLKDSREGRTVPLDEGRRRLGLSAE